MFHLSIFRVAAVLLVSATLSGCIVGVTPTATPVPTATPTAAASPTTITSHIANFTFANLTVRVGDTVRWVNDDGATHTSTSGQNGTFNGSGWNSPGLSQGQSFSHAFASAGVFSYTCLVHSFMNATVTVTD